MTKIEWTQETWNPVAGCSIVSPGCTNCYAMKMAARIQKMNRTGGSGSNYINHYDGTTKTVNGNAVWTGKLSIAPDSIFLKPLARKKPTMWFVNSMSDLFHEDMPDDVIDRVFAVMALTPQHTYQVLTKRPERMQQYFCPTGCVNCGCGQLDGRCCDEPYVLNEETGPAFRDALIEGAAQTLYSKRNPGDDPSMWLAVHMPLPNVWLGFSAEDQERFDLRWPIMSEIPAAVRFCSYEPAIGPLRLPIDGDDYDTSLKKLNWLICGGESGPRFRPMNPAWEERIRYDCRQTGIPYFFKQMAGKKPIPIDFPIVRQFPSPKATK